NKVWIATDRSRARRCVEACVYGTLDFVGYPRFPAPVEFIAAVIAYYVHPVNIQTACLIMEGAEFTENIINGVERPVKAAELFALFLIMFIPSKFKRPVFSWKALDLRQTLFMAAGVRLKPLNCSRFAWVFAAGTLTFLLTQKKTCVKNYVQKE